MSLLLDALKRAEQEKLARGDRPDLQVVQGGETSKAAAAAPAPGPRDKGALELQPIASQPHGGGTAAKAASAHAAQAVFDAKTAAADDSPARRGVIYAVMAAVVVAILAAGTYVWFTMQGLAPRTAPQRAAAAPAAPLPQASGPIPMPPAAPTPPPATAATLAPSLSVQLPTPSTAATAPLAPREQLIQQLLREPAAAREPPFKLDRSESRPQVPADVATAYEALRGGDLARARRSYQAALAADATNVDALLGMATLEARAGNLVAASALYRRSLDLDPRNQTALAGLASLAEPSRPSAVESQLRLDIAAYPRSPALHLALANLLAAQSRWSEAQPEYFEAHRLDPGNPDIAHNLAVSLDHLGQGRLAADYYRRALASAREQPAQFDAASVERRLAELAP